MSEQVSDFGPEIVDPGTGEFLPARAIVVEEIAKGSAGAFKRARRASPLEAIAECTGAMLMAARVYQQAYEHVQAGKGMGPLPWGRDVPISGRGGVMFHQERALSAAAVLRRGVQAMGQAASGGVVHWVVIEGGTLASYDAHMQSRRHSGRDELLNALERLAEAYGLADNP